MRNDKQILSKHFSKYATTYDEVATVQHRLQAALWDRWIGEMIDEESTRKIKDVLDLGCGPGTHAAKILGALPSSLYVGIDISENMLLHAKERIGEEFSRRVRWEQVDAEQWNWPVERFDVIHSNAVMQWFNDPDAAIISIVDAIQLNGWFIGTVFTQGTFKELKQAISDVNSLQQITLSSGPILRSVAAWNESFDVLRGMGHVVQTEIFCEQQMYADLRGMLKQIQQMGATDASEEVDALTGWTPKRMRQVEDVYRREHGTNDGIRATYEALCFWIQKRIET